MGLPMPNRRVSFKWRRRELNPQSRRFELRRFAGLRTAPCLSKATSTGFEPVISCVTGRRALQAAPRGRVQVAQVGVEPTASLVLSQGGLPVAYRANSSPGRTRTADRHLVRVLPSPLGYRTVLISVESPGVAPESPACHAGVFLLDHDPNAFSAEAVGLEPTSDMFAAACFPSRFLNHSDGFRYQSHQGGSRETRTHKRLSAATCFQDRALIQPDGFRLSSCGGWNRTNMKTFRASHPAVR